MQEIPRDLKRYLDSGQPLWLYNGNLQIRSLNPEPIWNSLHRYWHGDRAFYKHYRSLKKSDCPFAQDSFGDQFVLRNEVVAKLKCESDDLEETGLRFLDWLAWLDENPDDHLNVDCSLSVTPGKVLLAYPPFCLSSGSQSSIREIRLEEAHDFHAEIASKIRDLGNGEKIELRFEQPPGEEG